jgi:hypothetical protein
MEYQRGKVVRPDCAFRDSIFTRADVLLLTETDVGMAQWERGMARTLARELGMHYAFVPAT